MSQVFISYSKKDKALAKRFKSKVEKAGYQVWMDTRLRAGRDWRDTIDHEISQSIAVLVVMTPDARRSQYVTYECAFAFGAGVRVIQANFLKNPKRLHPRLSVLQYRDFTKAPFQWQELIEDLRDADKSSPSRLTIHRALWGPGKHIYDVTSKVQTRVRNNRIRMQANRDVPRPTSRRKEESICFLF